MAFEPPFPIGHLHSGEQQRIRAGNLNSHELAMLAKGEDPWAKFRGPQNQAEGTRLPGQLPAQTEQERIDAKLLDFMSQQVRAAYDAADSEQKSIIWEANKRAFGEAERRREQKLRDEQELMGKIFDAIQRVKENPDKADLLPPPNASIQELKKWYEDISKPVRPAPFANPSEQQIRQERMWRDIQMTGKADPNDIAEEEAEAERYRRELADARERKQKEAETKFGKPDLRQLQDEVDRASKVMGEAAKILRRKPEKELSITESKKISWIHRIPVWKEFGHWLKWASGCFAFALGMTQVNEYAWALAGLVGCGVCCLVQIYVWTASPNRFKNGIIKLFLTLISLMMILVSGLTVLKIKGDKPWSNLISVNRQATLPKPISSTELKSLPRFNNFMLEPRPIHDGGYLIYKAVHPADLSPIEFYVRLGMLNPEDVRVVVYVVRPYQVSLVAAIIAQHYETIVEQLKAQAEEKGFLDIVVSRTVVIHVDLSGGEPITIPKEARQKGINFEIERRLV